MNTAIRQPLTHRAVLSVAVPVMLSNVSTPLIGVVDTGVVGRLPDPAYIGAVAIGSLILSFVFWAFGFLRMGTTGLAAQAAGAGDPDETAAVLARGLLVAGAAGAGLILLQRPIRETAFFLLEGSAGVEQLAGEYFDIRIWAAPVTLANYALLGWFIGLGRTGIGLVLQLVLNLTNMALDAAFVLILGWGVAGVAFGTLLAETIAAVVGIVLAARQMRRIGARWRRDRIWVRERLGRLMALNVDIMVRTLALELVFAWFTARSAAGGDVILAANAVLLHFIAVAAYFLDGLAFATESLVGRAVGARDRAGLSAAARMATFWAAGLAVSISLLWLLTGTLIIDLLTTDPGARAAARAYLPWAAAVPVLGVWAFQLDGVFIGATRTSEMRNAMLASLAIFLASWWLLTPFGNHGLWAALHVQYAARAATLGRHYPRLVRSVGQ